MTTIIPIPAFADNCIPVKRRARLRKEYALANLRFAHAVESANVLLEEP